MNTLHATSVLLVVSMFLRNSRQCLSVLLSVHEIIVWSYAGERQSNINIADGKKNSVILESEAAKMDQVNRAQG